MFSDEAGASLTPIIRRTWAPRGKTPVLHHRFNWKRLSMAAALCYGGHGAAPGSPSTPNRSPTPPTV